MAENRAFMVMFEPYEAEVLIEGLMLYREESIKEWGTSDHRVDELLKHVLLHAGLPYCKKAFPKAYALCFPEGSPQIVGTYGEKYIGTSGALYSGAHYHDGHQD